MIPCTPTPAGSTPEVIEPSGGAIAISELCPDAAWIARVSRAFEWWSRHGWQLTGYPEPTSQVLGTGAIRVAENLFTRLHGGGQAVMTASNTAAMIAVLTAVRVTPGDIVLVQPTAWPSTRNVVVTLGGIPFQLPGASAGPVGAVEMETAIETVSRRRPDRRVTAAIVQQHPHHDYTAIQARWPQLPLIEDAAAAPVTPIQRRRGNPDIAIYSYGPGKAIDDIGEGGMIHTHHTRHHIACLQHATHPARHIISGIPAHHENIHTRPHPLAAILLAAHLAGLSGLSGKRWI